MQRVTECIDATAAQKGPEQAIKKLVICWQSRKGKEMWMENNQWASFMGFFEMI